MTALDTNVLIRYLVGDVPEQAEAASELVEALTPDDPGFICLEVVLEVALGAGAKLPIHQIPDC